MGMNVGGSGGGPRADINMTPMIDILLVLIIIFMVITPLTPKGLDTLVPQPAPPNQSADADQRTVVVTINADRSMMINQEATEESMLGGRLEEIFKTRAERVIFVKGDPNLEFEAVAKVIDIAKGAGIDKVGLMTPGVEKGE
ncbi:MAG: biopolymer transporter ExbD [Bryobacterales bacterium]|nr:biopolymer transporter ExbD [Bryobacterales bacterium]